MQVRKERSQRHADEQDSVNEDVDEEVRAEVGADDLERPAETVHGVSRPFTGRGGRTAAAST